MLVSSPQRGTDVSDPQLFDPSGRTLPRPNPSVVSILRRPGVAGWTLFVLGIQALALILQLRIISRQTSLMAEDAAISTIQQKLATRPQIAVAQFGSAQGNAPRSLEWKIRNSGPYGVNDVTIKFLHFRKFVRLGYHVVATNDELILQELKAGEISPLNISATMNVLKQFDIAGYAPVQFADFVVIALEFNRDVDGKRYLYLIPFMPSIEGDRFEMIRPQDTSSAGPLNKACQFDTYAVELAFEYFRRNPLPYPVELYNYHYLLGTPGTTCLESGPLSLRF